jgi:membrane-associated PAP2 superfamily phosphatase
LSAIRNAVDSPDSHRDPMRTPVIVLVVCAVLFTVPFWVSDLEIRIAALFYFPDHADGPWPVAVDQPWPFVYDTAGPLAALLGVGSLVIMIAAPRRDRWKALSRPALVVFLTLALGPGFLINVVLKNHWGRPRPNQITQFGEHWDYVPPWLKGPGGRGESFPSGHASVGFAYASLWVVSRRRHPRAAKAALAVSLAFGSLLGLTRITAGNHWVSDVAWSGIVTIAVAMVVHRLVETLPEKVPRADRFPASLRPTRRMVYGTLLAAAVIFGIICNPVYQELRWLAPPLPVAAPPCTVEIEVNRADVEIELLDRDAPPVRVSGKVEGMGHPSSGVHRHGDLVLGDPPVVRYVVQAHGSLIEPEGLLRFEVAARRVGRVVVHLEKGDVRIIRDPALEKAPRIDVTVREGTVIGVPGAR